MSRLFTGSAGFDQVLVLSPGAVTADTFTYVFLWIPKAGALTASGGIFQPRAGGSALRSIQTEPADDKYYFQGFSGFFSIAADDPAIIAVGKTAGSTALRLHWYPYSTATWSHTDGETFGNVGAPDELWLGKAFGRMSGLWVAGAAYSTNLSDAAIENAGYETGLSAWAATTPAALWAGNQALASDPVEDLTGNGADQTSVIGTAPAVDAEEPPGWSYDLGATGTLTATLPALTASVTGSAAASGSLAAVLPGIEATSIGSGSSSGLLAATLPALAVSAAGSARSTAALAVTLPALAWFGTDTTEPEPALLLTATATGSTLTASGTSPVLVAAGTP